MSNSARTRYPRPLSMVVHHQPPPVPQPVAGGVPSLHVFDGDHVQVAVRHLRPAGLTIGSAPSVDITVEGAGVSPAHVRVDFDGRRVFVTDLGSADGTRLEGHHLLPQVSQEWGREQWLQIGSCWLWVQQPIASITVPIVELLLDQNGRQLSITPGQPAACQLTIVNQTIHVDLVTLSVEGIPAEWVEHSQKETKLHPHARKEVTLTVNVPKTPAGRAGARRVTIRVNSTASPQIEHGSVTAYWTVLPFHATSATIAPGKAGAVRQAISTVTLHNGGNAPVSYMLSGSDDEGHLEFLLSGEGINDVCQLPVSLDPGARTRIRLKTLVPRRWVGGATTHRLTVQGIAEEGAAPDVAVEAQFTHRATFPWWVLAVVPVVLMLGWFLGRSHLKPVVDTISVEPRTPRAGEQVEIRFDAPRATRVRLFANDMAERPDPDVREGRYVFPKGFERDTRIRLVATNIFGTASGGVDVTIVEEAPPPPIVEMTVRPTTVTKGGLVTVVWRVLFPDDGRPRPPGTTLVDFNLTGTVSPEGRHIDRPEADQVYTITASYRGVTVTRSIPVKMIEPGKPPPNPTLTVASPPPSDNGQIEVEVGDRVVLKFAAMNATALRIDGVTPLPLEGSSGQRSVELKGEGRYVFTLVATDDKNQEFRSASIEVVARCPSFLKRPWPFRCNRDLEVEWK